MRRGYYETPNVDVPYNKREKGEIAPIAYEQLQPFRDAALCWPIGVENRRQDADSPIRACNICRVCSQNIWFVRDLNNELYGYSEDEIIALIVAHLRQVHAEAVAANDPYLGRKDPRADVF